jgi:hypothetical protein
MESVMQVCKEVQDWIEENIEKEIEQQETRCKSWPWPLNWLCSVVTFLVKIIVVVGKWVARIVCEIVMLTLNSAAAFANFLLAIPFLGWIFRWLIRLGMWFASLVLGTFDAVGRTIGIRTTKRLRIRIVPLKYEGLLTATPEILAPAIQRTREILRNSAGINAIITVEDAKEAPAYVMDLAKSCEALGTSGSVILEELGMAGSWFQLSALSQLDDQVSNLIGFGNPVYVYVVRRVGFDVEPSGPPGAVVSEEMFVGGIAIGPTADWVAVDMRAFLPTRDPALAELNLNVIAHEVVHALGYLAHDSEAGNLMTVSTDGVGAYLTPFQVGLIRNSPKVTFL